MINTSTSDENLCGLKRADFQTTVNGKQTDLFILKNENGAEIAVTNYGGAVLAIMVPDKNGKYANVIQGHDSITHVSSGRRCGCISAALFHPEGPFLHCRESKGS